jgi:hypothetical protein
MDQRQGCAETNSNIIIDVAPQGYFDMNGHWLTCNQLPVFRLQAEPGFVQGQPLDKFQAIHIKDIEFVQLTGQHSLMKLDRLHAKAHFKPGQLSFKSAHLLYECFEFHRSLSINAGNPGELYQTTSIWVA